MRWQRGKQKRNKPIVSCLVCLLLSAMHVSYRKKSEWTVKPELPDKSMHKPKSADAKNHRNSWGIEWKGSVSGMMVLAYCLVSVGISGRDTGNDEQQALQP